MKSFGLRQTLLGVALVVAACSGCSHEVRTTPVAPPRYANPTPEQSFDTIFDMFKRRIEDTPVGFVVSDSSGRSSLVGKNTVSKELIPPAKEGEPFKAIITVTSESRYSIMRTKETGEENPAEQSNSKKASDPLAEQSGEQQGELGEVALQAKPTADVGKGRVATDVIKPPGQEKADIRKYELEYKNGRWELKTELNSKTEQSIQNAFKNALDTQNI
jgi:hypothetical protein